MKKALFIMIPLLVAGVLVGAAILFRFRQSMTVSVTETSRQLPNINAGSVKKPVSGLGGSLPEPTPLNGMGADVILPPGTYPTPESQNTPLRTTTAGNGSQIHPTAAATDDTQSLENDVNNLQQQF
jgi:hypothetical protein